MQFIVVTLAIISLSVLVSFYQFHRGASWRVGMATPAVGLLASGIVTDWIAGKVSVERAAVWAVGALGF